MNTLRKHGLKLAAGLAIALVLAGVVIRVLYFEHYGVDEDIDVNALLANDSFSHAPLDAVLRAFVNDRGEVDYEALRKQPEDLRAYLATIAKVGPTQTPTLFSKEADRLAFFINAYNAFVLWGVVQRPDIKSVHDEKIRFFYGTTFDIDGGTTNLYHLENTTIRQGFDDPRIHFVLNCASLGCPQLPRHAFTGGQLEQALERETKAFLDEERNLKIAPDGSRATVSKIFKWYASDFKPTPAAWIAKRRPALAKDASLAFRAWDWTLNTPGARSRPTVR